MMRFLRYQLCLCALASITTIAAPLAAQDASDCERWVQELASGGESALRAVTYGWIPGCPGDTAPPVLAAAIPAARTSRDTAFLGRLAAEAAQVRDTRVFNAAIEVANDRGATDRARIMALLVAAAHVGSSMDMPGWTRDQLFTETLPATEICGFGTFTVHGMIDNGLPADAERQYARAIDGILYNPAERVQLRNFARCARSVVARVPPQVDLGRVRIDYVCDSRFRIQNHTGVNLMFHYVVLGAPEAEESPKFAPAIGGWTTFDVWDVGPLQVSYDGRIIATVQNDQKRCGPGRS